MPVEYFEILITELSGQIVRPNYMQEMAKKKISHISNLLIKIEHDRKCTTQSIWIKSFKAQPLRTVQFLYMHDWEVRVFVWVCMCECRSATWRDSHRSCWHVRPCRLEEPSWRVCRQMTLLSGVHWRDLKPVLRPQAGLRFSRSAGCKNPSSECTAGLWVVI